MPSESTTAGWSARADLRLEIRDEPPDDAPEPRASFGPGCEDLVVRQWLARIARTGVGDQRYAADLETRPARRDALDHRRHPDRVSAHRGVHPDLGGRFVVRPGQADVDPFGELDVLDRGCSMEPFPK